MEIANKVFIVTGGASGLGAGTARMLSQERARVVLADVQDEAGQALAAELGQRYVHCDVTQEADAQAVVGAALELGALFGLVNCAGVAPAARTVGKNGAHALDLFQKVISINLVGTFNMIRIAAQAMSKNEPEASGERGVLINTASVAAYDGQIGQSAYAASKSGVVGMTLPIARDLAPLGIRVNAVGPGPTLPNYTQDRAAFDREARAVPLERGAEPAEIAEAVAYLARARAVTGQMIAVDGGQHLAWKTPDFEG